MNRAARVHLCISSLIFLIISEINIILPSYWSHFLNALHKFQLKPVKILQILLFQFQQDGGIRHAILCENGAIPRKGG